MSHIKNHRYFIHPIVFVFLLGILGYTVTSFQILPSPHSINISIPSSCQPQQFTFKSSFTCLSSVSKSQYDEAETFEDSSSRRKLLQWGMHTGWMMLSLGAPPLVMAELLEDTTATQQSTEEKVPAVRLPLYYILRVREATEQESRLISSGKFKDVQRANVKLAVRFLLQNYKLSDNIISAAATLDDSSKRQAATEVGQRAVENLYTILEYFDSRDVENLKVGSFDSMAGKEPLVLKGLDAARSNIDEFLTYLDRRDVDAVRTKIEAENELNAKEFDSSLGVILNPNPSKK